MNVDDLSKGSQKEIIIQCDYCETTFFRTFERHIKIRSIAKNPKDNCKKCWSQKASEINSYRIISWKKVIAEFNKRNYIVISTEQDYKNGGTPIDYSCRKHPELGIQQLSYSELMSKKILSSGYISIRGCSSCIKRRLLEDRKNNPDKYNSKINRIGKSEYKPFYKIDIDECKRRFEEKGATFLDDQEYKGDKHYYYFTCEKHLHKGVQKKKLNYLKNPGLRFACRYCGIESRSKENSPLWRGGKANEIQQARQSAEYREWKRKVFERDGYICQACGDYKGKNLQAHHILNFAEHPKERFKVSNGITLCNNCHNPNVEGSFHYLYSTEKNTKEQLDAFIKLKNKQHNIDKDTINTIREKIRVQRLLTPYKRPASTKLSDQSVLEIIERLKHGDCYDTISHDYNVSKSTICEIAKGKRFRDITKGKIIR